MQTLRNDAQTHWGAIWVVFLAACTLALHQGKMPAAIGLLQVEFDLSLTAVGWILSVYAVVISSAALAIGMLVTRVGHTRVAIAGVALSGIGGVIGVVGNTCLLYTSPSPRDRG